MKEKKSKNLVKEFPCPPKKNQPFDGTTTALGYFVAPSIVAN